MNPLAALLLCLAFGLLVGGMAMITPAAGVLTAGLLTAVAGVLALSTAPAERKAKQ